MKDLHVPKYHSLHCGNRLSIGFLSSFYCISSSCDVLRRGLLLSSQVPEGFGFQGAPVVVEEEVVTGFGRGSRQMGVPTANLKPQSLFAGPLNHLPLGVYFGSEVHSAWVLVGLSSRHEVSMSMWEADCGALHLLHVSMPRQICSQFTDTFLAKDLWPCFEKIGRKAPP